MMGLGEHKSTVHLSASCSGCCQRRFFTHPARRRAASLTDAARGSCAAYMWNSGRHVKRVFSDVGEEEKKVSHVHKVLERMKNNGCKVSFRTTIRHKKLN